MDRRTDGEEGQGRGGANPGLPRKLRENGNTGRVVANVKAADACESTVNMNEPRTVTAVLRMHSLTEAGS